MVEAGSQAHHIPAHTEGNQMEDTHPGVLSQGLEMAHISSTCISLDEDLVTGLHLLQGRLRSVAYLSSLVPSQISVTLGEEENDFGRTTGNGSHLGIVGTQSYHWDKMR